MINQMKLMDRINHYRTVAANLEEKKSTRPILFKESDQELLNNLYIAIRRLESCYAGMNINTKNRNL